MENIYFMMTQLSWDESLGSRSHMAISARVPGGAPAAGDQSRPGSELPSLNLPARGRERARFLLDFWDNITIFIVKNLHSPAQRKEPDKSCLQRNLEKSRTNDNE